MPQLSISLSSAARCDDQVEGLGYLDLRHQFLRSSSTLREAASSWMSWSYGAFVAQPMTALLAVCQGSGTDFLAKLDQLVRLCPSDVRVLRRGSKCNDGI